MVFEKYAFTEVEPAILEFWQSIGFPNRLHTHNPDGTPFYFLDGPPYTSGKVHIGTAWNKSMKDLVVRYRRMQGRKVWDRAGYDMHGLPTENATMKELGLTTKEDIEAYGLSKFITACKELAQRNLKIMNEDFTRLGVSLDFENAYQTMSDEWVESVWWLMKKAHTDGRLYKGLRPMAWDPEHESACAKHELFYKQVEDTSIYVKFERVDKPKEFLIIWTTTPWTIPLNLMIMVNPKVEYAKVKVGDETWIIASDRVNAVLETAAVEGSVEETVLGEDLVGMEYTHFFEDVLDYASIKKDHPKTHTVVASTEYVTTESGSGLVHTAPGCGPEDYEIGVRENVPAFNLLDEKGYYPEGTGPFSGVRARTEDEKFVEQIEIAGNLVAKEQYLHDYPFAERSKAAVVYKATEQWFLKVDDLKENMITGNNEVQWTPKAGYNAFNSWLENLRDNSITKQRFWGTPFPVWQNTKDPEDIIIIGSKAELEELAGAPIEDVHKPWIDDIVINKDGKTYKRVPDVIDVWVDAGVASWSCLDFPKNKEAFEEFFPAEFIIEGNDQVRGWFNLLMVTSMLAFEKVPFKNVYMHGMVQDAQGRKMSKSLGNYIRPEEVINKFGADAVRLYFISGTRAGNDLSYNFADCQNKQRNLFVYWNIHKYLSDLIKTSGCKPRAISEEQLTLPEKYIVSLANETLQEVEKLMDQYLLDRIPVAVENLLGEISRTYIQLVRTQATNGTAEQQQRVISTLYYTYDIALRLLTPICPFISEAIWQNLRADLDLTEESVHLTLIPNADTSLIDAELVQAMKQAQQTISALLAARDSANIGVRWPLGKAQLQGIESLPEEVKAIVLEQTNIKSIEYIKALPVKHTLKPNYRALGKEFGQETADIAQAISKNSESLGDEFAKNQTITVLGHELTETHLTVERHAPEGFAFASNNTVSVLLDTAQDEALLLEGYYRELGRRIQQMRKEGDLDKTDRIHVILAEDLKEIVNGNEEDLKSLVGADKLDYGNPETAPHVSKTSVKEKELHVGFFFTSTQ